MLRDQKLLLTHNQGLYARSHPIWHVMRAFECFLRVLRYTHLVIQIQYRSDSTLKNTLPVVGCKRLYGIDLAKTNSYSIYSKYAACILCIPM